MTDQTPPEIVSDVPLGTPPMTIRKASWYPIVILDENNKMMVRLHGDGHVEYGEGYTPDDGAKKFWDAMSFHMPKCTCGAWN